MAKTNETASFRQIGQHGVSYALHDGHLILSIPVTDKARAAALPSSTGKTRLVGNTGGFVAVPGTDLRVSAIVSVPPAAPSA